MKRDNGKNRRKSTGLSKAKIALTVGYTAFALLAEGYLIYKEKQGDISASFPEAENEINEAVSAVIAENAANANANLNNNSDGPTSYYIAKKEDN